MGHCVVLFADEFLYFKFIFESGRVIIGNELARKIRGEEVDATDLHKELEQAKEAIFVNEIYLKRKLSRAELSQAVQLLWLGTRKTVGLSLALEKIYDEKEFRERLGQLKEPLRMLHREYRKLRIGEKGHTSLSRKDFKKALDESKKLWTEVSVKIEKGHRADG